jgi:hypothetical protein
LNSRPLVICGGAATHLHYLEQRGERKLQMAGRQG